MTSASSASSASGPPPLGPGEIDMDEIARLVRAADMPAFVGHVGGGGSVVYAGDRYLAAEGDRRYPAAAGPGRFVPDPAAGWAVAYARGLLEDFYFGPDEGLDGDGQFLAAAQIGVLTPAQAAAVLVAQVLAGQLVPGRCLTVVEARRAVTAAGRL